MLTSILNATPLVLLQKPDFWRTSVTSRCSSYLFH